MKSISAKPASVLMRPRVTEKAALSADQKNVYVFEVSKDATKKTVVASIKDVYKVTPAAVRFVAIPKKMTLYRGRKGTKGGGKKAYVALKKGDKIEIM